MVFEGTVLWVIDNSGAKKVRCIKILDIGARRYGVVGDVLVVSMIDGLNNKNVMRGRIYKAVVVRTRSAKPRKGGELVRFQDNGVVLIKGDKMPVGTRLLGPIMLELRFKGYIKIVSLALAVI